MQFFSTPDNDQLTGCGRPADGLRMIKRGCGAENNVILRTFREKLDSDKYFLHISIARGKISYRTCNAISLYSQRYAYENAVFETSVTIKTWRTFAFGEKCLYIIVRKKRTYVCDISVVINSTILHYLYA